MKLPELWIERLHRASSWRIWILIHLVALALQWATIRAAPIAMQHSNGKGWWALCMTAKGP